MTDMACGEFDYCETEDRGWLDQLQKECLLTRSARTEGNGCVVARLPWLRLRTSESLDGQCDAMRAGVLRIAGANVRYGKTVKNLDFTSPESCPVRVINIRSTI